MGTVTHLHARYSVPAGSLVSCATVCGLPCDSVVTLYRGLIDGPVESAVSCRACVAGLPNDRPRR